MSFTLKSIRLSLVVLAMICIKSNLKAQSMPRGRACWVFRSVLDSKPRMLTIALSPHVWVAYDLTQGNMYKAWAEGVKLDGTIYTSKHGPQPTTLGTHPYIPISNADTCWSVYNGEKTLKVTVKYLGHVIMNNRATLKYALKVPELETPILIEESPEMAPPIKGKNIGLERSFVVRNLPPNYKVSVKVETGSVLKREDIVSNGNLVIFEKKERYPHAKPQLFFSAWLDLSANSPTLLTNYFTAY